MKTIIQRTLALLLMLVMVVTMLPLGALATTTNSGSPVIETDENGDPIHQGSITVTKFATKSSSEGSNAPVTKGEGTGMEITAGDWDGYQTLKDANFVLVQIYEADKVMDYYDGTNDSLVLDTTKLVKTETGWTYNGTPVDSSKIRTGTTDANGQYRFETLPVGIYILREVTAPDQITNPLAEDSLISIPMVNSATSSNNENKEWMYDVYVYPKNHEATATVELTKVGPNEELLNNVYFDLFKYGKKDDNTEGWIPVTEIKANDGTPSTLTLKTGNIANRGDGMMILANLPAGLNGTQYKLIEKYVTGTTSDSPEGYIINNEPLYFTVNPDNTITWNVDGTYENQNIGVIEHKDAATEGQPDDLLTITLRNEQPTLEKRVQKSDGTSFDTHAQYRMDETITYQLTVSVPQNVHQMKTFTIVDTPDAGINDVVTSVQVSYNDGNTTYDLASATQFNVVATTPNGNGTGFTLTFSDEIKSTIAGKILSITYQAGLTEKAVIAGEGNDNAATLTYSKYANTASTAGTEETYTITDHARVYTYEYDITKTLKDAGANDSPKGVEFELLDKDQTSRISVVSLNKDSTGKDLGGKYRLVTSGESGATTTLITDGNGKIIIQGLKSQNYYLKETKTVTGYNLLSAPFEITVNVQKTTKWTDNWEQGTAFEGNAKIVKEHISTDYGNVDPTGTSTIINKKGFVLPQTGSMGYLLFCAVGLVLIAGGMLLIFGGRKKKIR